MSHCLTHSQNDHQTDRSLHVYSFRHEATVCSRKLSFKKKTKTCRCWILGIHCHVENILVKVIPAMFEETRPDVQASLKQAQSILITTNSWTSRATQSYMTVTESFVSNDWQIRNHVLPTRVISVSHMEDLT